MLQIAYWGGNEKRFLTVGIILLRVLPGRRSRVVVVCSHGSSHADGGLLLEAAAPATARVAAVVVLVDVAAVLKVFGRHGLDVGPVPAPLALGTRMGAAHDDGGRDAVADVGGPDERGRGLLGWFRGSVVITCNREREKA